MKIATRARVGLAQWQVLAIAGEARLDPRTVFRVLEGTSRSSRADNIRQQVVDAAARLGISLPAPPGGIDPNGLARIRAT